MTQADPFNLRPSTLSHKPVTQIQGIGDWCRFSGEAAQESADLGPCILELHESLASLRKEAQGVRSWVLVSVVFSCSL